MHFIICFRFELTLSNCLWFLIFNEGQKITGIYSGIYLDKKHSVFLQAFFELINSYLSTYNIIHPWGPTLGGQKGQLSPALV